jgi:hypothetical protein
VKPALTIALIGDCGAWPAHVSALRTPAQGSGFFGGMNRLRPPVGAP